MAHQREQIKFGLILGNQFDGLLDGSTHISAWTHHGASGDGMNEKLELALNADAFQKSGQYHFFDWNFR